jgi:hypothetical protein
MQERRESGVGNLPQILGQDPWPCSRYTFNNDTKTKMEIRRIWQLSPTDVTLRVQALKKRLAALGPRTLGFGFEKSLTGKHFPRQSEAAVCRAFLSPTLDAKHPEAQRHQDDLPLTIHTAQQ